MAEKRSRGHKKDRKYYKYLGKNKILDGLIEEYYNLKDSGIKGEIFEKKRKKFKEAIEIFKDKDSKQGKPKKTRTVKRITPEDKIKRAPQSGSGKKKKIHLKILA